jgi:NADH dehydrogenase FAD-containing subunit
MPRIVIAGGGIAGLEALVALRAHLGPQAEIQLLEANAELVERQRAVVEPFDAPSRVSVVSRTRPIARRWKGREHTALLHSVWTHRLRVAEC